MGGNYMFSLFGTGAAYQEAPKEFLTGETNE